MMTKQLLYEVKNHHIALVTFNRPQVMNAMSLELLNELNECIHSIRNNSSIRVVILSGKGSKAFCAGADLKERKTMTDNETLQTVQFIRDTINKLEQLPVPVIAAINGVAVGGGLEIALACDIRVCATHAKVGLTETSLAIIPGAGGTQRLPRLIGIGRAKKMIYTSEAICAEQALSIGLVEEVVKPNHLLDYALGLAGKISMNGPIAIKQAKL